jgi:hypothetical protein
MSVQDVLPRGAIPSIDDPAFGADYFGAPDDEVIVLDGDPPRAYPVRVLSYHEVVNDVVDGRPVAVTWCPICWSAAVYDRTVDGRTLTFGVSGKLADDALVMYDRETESEWKQPTGTAIAGQLEGERLTVLEAPVVTWERFRTDHPDGVVLQPVRGTDASVGRPPADVYDMNPYERYAESDEFGLYGMRGEGDPREWDRTDLDPKAVVLGVESGEEAVGYPISRVEAAGGAVTDTVGDRGLLVVADVDAVHASADPGHGFAYLYGTLHADGTTWDPATGRSADGRALARVPSRRLFAFAWQDDHGPEAFY